MNRTLSWADLFIEDPMVDFARIFACWPQYNFSLIRPIGLSVFGDCYFETDDGTVHVLDPIERNIREVAPSTTDFAPLMNSAQWQDANLMPAVVAAILSQGISRGAVQVFGFAPHPAITGRIVSEQAIALDAVVWHSICSQIKAQAVPSA